VVGGGCANNPKRAGHGLKEKGSHEISSVGKGRMPFRLRETAVRRRKRHDKYFNTFRREERLSPERQRLGAWEKRDSKATSEKNAGGETKFERRGPSFKEGRWIDKEGRREKQEFGSQIGNWTSVRARNHKAPGGAPGKRSTSVVQNDSWGGGL